MKLAFLGSRLPPLVFWRLTDGGSWQAEDALGTHPVLAAEPRLVSARRLPAESQAGKPGGGVWGPFARELAPQGGLGEALGCLNDLSWEKKYKSVNEPFSRD